MDAVTDKLDGRWGIKDYIGTVMCLLGIRRKFYKQNPGLYSIGNPDSKSPVFVTANYKYSADVLRRALKNTDAWILVIDTKGINVWCAAGKGTFGTAEIISRVNKTGLKDTVSHRTLILPQLGAPGVKPAEVRKNTGFSVKYGPVEADDIPQFIKNGFTADRKMRTKQFRIPERLAVSLTHMVQGLLPTAAIALFFVLVDFLFSLKGNSGVTGFLSINISASLGALLGGTLIAGALLPLLPGRAFSIKGFFISILFALFFFQKISSYSSPLFTLYTGGKILILAGWIVYLVLNLTGSSTYTSLSGVKKETAISLPLVAAGSFAGLAMIITGGILL
ncbi:MAG: acetyl-CoA synthase subunit gamma [Spirochaetales bacterium]|nr:acetyl-CoA synthase subunit gamma [Spirochaetales bacterium]